MNKFTVKYVQNGRGVDVGLSVSTTSYNWLSSNTERLDKQRGIILLKQSLNGVKKLVINGFSANYVNIERGQQKSKISARCTFYDTLDIFGRNASVLENCRCARKKRLETLRYSSADKWWTDKWRTFMLKPGVDNGICATKKFVRDRERKQIRGSLPISWLLDSPGASTELLVCQGVLQNRIRYVGARVRQFDQPNKGLTCGHFSFMLWPMDAYPADVLGEATVDGQRGRRHAGMAVVKRGNIEDGGPPGATPSGKRGADVDDTVEDRGEDGRNGRNGLNRPFYVGDMFVCTKLTVEIMHFIKSFCTKYSTIFNHDKSDAQIGGHFNWPPIRFKFEHFVFLLKLKLQVSLYKLSRLLTSIVIITARHLGILCRIALRYDIEPNPGPKESIRVMTINCRGLGNINKFRHLLNRAYEIIAKGPAIVFLQETMIIDSQYLNIAWHGKHVLTAGLGNSQGCITLVSDSVSINDIVHMGHRAHTFTAKGLIDTEVMVANVYAPIGYDDKKMHFFSSIFDRVLQYTGDSVILGGDLNLTFTVHERVGGVASAAEVRVASMVKDRIQECGLLDTWEGRQGHTWHRGKLLSD